MEYSAHAPSQFIRTHADQLLPAWSASIASVVIVLQRSQVNLLQRSAATEQEKRRLRSQFVEFACRISQQLEEMGYVADAFDPRTGLPLFSQPGSLQLDDVALAQSLLGYQTKRVGACNLIIHPTWGEAVYPATVVSSASPAIATLAVDCVSQTLPLNKTPSFENSKREHPSFASRPTLREEQSSTSPSPFSQKRRRGAGFKVPRPLGEGFRVRATKVGCTPASSRQIEFWRELCRRGMSGRWSRLMTSHHLTQDAVARTRSRDRTG